MNLCKHCRKPARFSAIDEEGEVIFVCEDCNCYEDYEFLEEEE